MDLPATYYGPLDKRNPVILNFKRDMKSFSALMKKAASSTDNSLRAKGVTCLVEIWRKYKHRLPEKFYQEHMLQIADFLYEMKLYQLALMHGYSLYLLHFTSVQITEFSDVDHFLTSFFPAGLDTKQDSFVKKIRALLGCALCIFEAEKKCSILSQKGLDKLLSVLNFIRIMMQAFQPNQHLSWLILHGSSHIYNICRYLMIWKFSEQALEYLLWASTSLEVPVPLMTTKNLSLIVPLYCAVCYCYYDNQAAVQAEEFAKRALRKINKLAEEETSEVAANEEAQRAFKEASIKLGVLMFKRAVFDPKRRPQIPLRTKSTHKGVPIDRGPHTPTEHMLISQFDCTAGQFWGILEALWDSNLRPLQMKMPDDVKQQKVVLELLSAGISLLSGGTSTDVQKHDDHQCLSSVVLTPTSTLMDLAITGERKIPVISAVKFIKLLLQYKQPEMFKKAAEEMLSFLSGVEGQPFRQAERELTLLHSFNSLLFSQEGKYKAYEHKPSNALISAELTGLVKTLHVSVCGSDPEVQPNPDLVLDAVSFLWEKLKVVMLQTPEFTHDVQKIDDYDKWLWCVYALCEVGLASELADFDCILMAKMILMFGIQLEKTAETQGSAGEGPGHVEQSSMFILKRSKVALLKMVCEVVQKGLEALSKGVSTHLPRDSSVVTDSVFTQKFTPTHSLGAPAAISEEETGEGEVSMKKKEEKEDGRESGFKGCEQIQPVSMFLLAKDLHLELDVVYHKASLKLQQLKEVSERKLLDRIKNNKLSKAHFLIQKALLEQNSAEPSESITVKKLLEEASTLIEKEQMKERKLYLNTLKPQSKNKAVPVKGENPPPPPILISQTDHSLAFVPAPYDMEEQVTWYQLFGRVAEGTNIKVRLGDCSIPGTGNMVLVASGDGVLRVEGLQANQKYVFAVAAYNSQAKLLGGKIGSTTLPVLASIPVPLLPTWAHLAKVAFQTKQYAIAKKACGELWSHFTDLDSKSSNTQDRPAALELHQLTLRHSSTHLSQLFLTSIFIETEINIEQGSLYSFSDSGRFAWEQEARLAECERVLVAMDLAKRLKDGRTALQAVHTCYRLLAPLIFNQIAYDPVVKVLNTCLVVLEENSFLLNQKWPGNMSESLQHMVACITYYLSKSFHVSRNDSMADAVMNRGCRILQEAYDAHLKNNTSSKQAMNLILQLKELQRKNEKRISKPALNMNNKVLLSPAGCDDPAVLYDLISHSSLNMAYKKVMMFRYKPRFLEFAALLFQRSIAEGQPDLVINWEEEVSLVLSRRYETLRRSSTELEDNNKSKPNNTPQSQSNDPDSQDEMRRRVMQILPSSLFQQVRTNREMQMVDKLLNMMLILVQKYKKRIQLRKVFAEESAWRASINYSIAQAHLQPLYQRLDQILDGPLQHRYIHIDPLWFSLANSGVLMKRNSQSAGHNTALDRDSLTGAVRADDSVTEESFKEGGSLFQTVEQQAETENHTSATFLDSIKKAALHLRRAMVLAHRVNHWTSLQHICQTVWYQSRRITAVTQKAADFKVPSSDTAGQLSAIFTSLLVLAADLIMDMVTKLQIWSVYDHDVTEKEHESSLHFSWRLDDSTMVDLRWVRSLVLHTLELLHDSCKWESLAHFALLFNSYTRERYALTIAPLLVHAQRKLLERISSLGGPAVPQPHHVKTQRATGKEVSYRSYADCQLLSGWTSHSAQKQHHSRHTPRDGDSLKGLEMKLSMLLVCVPLDVEDTLSCYHQAVKKTPHCLQALQHSRLLLMKLLAHTQPYFVEQLPPCRIEGLSQADLSPAAMSTPHSLPPDLCEEDFGARDSIYAPPISPDHISAVAATYSYSIKCLQEKGRDSLRVQALHEKGNLEFYTGNTSAAHSCWSKAVDCVFQRTGVLKKWDGVSFGCGSFQQTVQQAGVWGCLQAAVLTAKIAHYIFTSDISQRTSCCLLSAHLFKCVLCCSLAHPQADLQYATYSIGDELLPGVDLFSEPSRLHLGTTASAITFICHWLFATGHYIKLLPMLALNLHVFGNLCRHAQRTAEGHILKVRTLTELCLFSEAVTEAAQLTQGTGILLPHEEHITTKDLQPVKTFNSSKSLLENVEALEDLVSCDFAADICALFGPTLCIRFNFARIQLILALANSVGDHPVSVAEGTNTTSHQEKSEHHEQDRVDTEDSCPRTQQTKVLTFYKEEEIHSLGRMKCLLLEEASTLLSSAMQQLTSHHCSEVEKLELTLESNFLKANLYLQQGQAALSIKAAASSLKLLQTSPVILREADSATKQDFLYEDCPSAAEAGDRIGVSLWLRCRLSLVQSLTANISDAAFLFPGESCIEGIARVIQDGLDECVQWKDCDTQALLMVERAKLEAERQEG